MITIGIPSTYIQDGKAYLKAPIRITDDTVQAYRRLQNTMHKTHWRVNQDYPPAAWNEQDAGLWFSVDEDYAPYLWSETADAFVCAMLWYAMTTGSDIVSEAPVSERMLFSVNQYLIPALCNWKNGFKRICVSGPSLSVSCPPGNGVGTGMSCGIDSLYTLRKYMDVSPEQWRLTHLAYFNMGAIFHPNTAKNAHYSINDFYETTDRMTLEKKQAAFEVAKEVGMPLVYISSNLDRDYYRGAYGYTAVYRNCACVLALQKLFDQYYCSSAGWPDFFDLSLSEGSEHYESLLCQCLSTENCTFVLSDYATRIEKTRDIADWNLAQRYLDVCFNFNNCGHCDKCYRTLLTLDLLGKVDEFGSVFDVDEYKRSRSKAIGWLLYKKRGEARDDNVVFAREVFDLLKANNEPIPVVSYYHMVKQMATPYRNIVKRGTRKIRRLLKNVFSANQ